MTIYEIDAKLNRYFKRKFDGSGDTLDTGFFWVRSLSNKLKIRFYGVSVATKATIDYSDIIPGPDLR